MALLYFREQGVDVVLLEDRWRKYDQRSDGRNCSIYVADHQKIVAAT